MSAVLTDVCKNACLDSAVSGAPGSALFLGLHTTPGQAGTEVAGGSPAYARKAITWQAAGAVTQGAKDLTAAVTFDIPAATTVRGVGLWSASTAGTIRAWSPAGASARRAFTVPDAAAVTANLIYSPTHGLVAGNSVLVWPTIGAVLPTGLAEDTEYFVIAAGLTTDAFSISATSGGSAIDITAIGDGDVQKFTPEVFAGQGTYQVTAFTVSLPG
jgi:hypothetical protein